mmetsp:Transcript_16709/g.20846  ORF Transcript_16709/g.20846 Transcript_16709/m.20846 type:complete len:187 (+) Transcript_16709:81-641(+)|eukprot:CAMPEP_0172498888 /NCGR_PEP_ID=MMETSP1066-20121228/119117_1 /TAXON_ID=671091 /ORGANISM="Coscinodiscus wailesii, Strain CCMP2513" /LENGTH=186 /DNA_ID=CAMNT_0013272351 /DNA_START=81 /DNA_END=641 /DNA_ORIENTATION=+
MVDVTLYKVGVVLGLEGCGHCRSKSGKALKACKIKVSLDNGVEPITVVTSASNVREGSRIVVAPVGTTYMDEQGQEHLIQRTSVGGVVSEGMLCDSNMLGWLGGGRGVAAQLPDYFEIGSPPPSEKPRPRKEVEEVKVETPPPVEPQGLFEKKLSKEERKKLAEERRRARKAAKAAKKAAEENGDH